MSSMPIIDDRMVDLFRRTGKRRASYRSAQGGRAAAAAQRVVLQRSCSIPNTLCITDHGAQGICGQDHICRIFPFDPDNRFPQFP